VTTEGSRADSIALPEIGDASFQAALAAAVRRAPDQQLACAGIERLLEVGGSSAFASFGVSGLDGLACIVGASTALTRYLASQGSQWPVAAARIHESNPPARALRARADLIADDGFDRIAVKLRTVAKAEMFRIGARDLLGLASLHETLTALTQLADVSIDLATRSLRTLLARDGGDAVAADGRPIGFAVVGLGKLGGGELNYSSDVDLVYLYADDPPAAQSPQPREFFAKLAADVSRMIGEQTADGHVFRVDLRLRPEGQSGPLVNSVENALAYYEGWGDTWERGVLAKARHVGGDAEVTTAFVDQVRPFVFRRHLDYQTVEDFRRMKDKIDAEHLLQARGVRDVKLGWGGIRELEFVVQILQLIHAGHHPELQVQGSMASLDALESHGLIAVDQANLLRQAYAFLRNTEHAIQVVDQRHSQRLPSSDAELRSLARRLGYGTGRRGAAADCDEQRAFEVDWKRHTENVREAFVRFLELRPEERTAGADAQANVDPQAIALLDVLERGERDRAVALLEQMGFPDGPKAAHTLGRLYRGRVAGPASPQRRRAVESMAPALLSAAAASADPEAALDRLVEFLIHTGAHTSYLALLSGSPATMRLLISLFATSSYLASSLAGHPELLDTLVRSDADPSGRSATLLREALDEDLAGDLDEEQVMEVLRHFRTTELIRAGMDDLSGLLDAEQVEALLSDLAEACLTAAADHAYRLVAERSGVPATGVELGIVALGKMGGREMTYGSDLDLLFVYRGAATGFDDLAHSFATRWVQKIMSLLQTTTRGGIVYKIDARLRPSGRAGPLVASMDRFVEYHEKEAALWERQAHIRARVVYGAAGLAEDVQAVIEHFVYGQGLDDAGVVEIDRARRDVEDELAAETATRSNIKTGRGGIVDIEFIVQMLVLRHGHDHPEVRKRGTLAALRALDAAELLEGNDGAALERHYLFLRRLEARMRLERDRPVEELGMDTELLGPLARRLGFGDGDPGAALLRAYTETREQVRASYERYFSVRVDV